MLHTPHLLLPSSCLLPPPQLGPKKHYSAVGIAAVIAAMRSLPTFSAVQLRGCNFLHTFVQDLDITGINAAAAASWRRATAVKAGALGALAAALDIFPDHLGIQRSCCESLKCIAFENTLLAHNASVLRACLGAMLRHANDAELAKDTFAMVCSVVGRGTYDEVSDSCALYAHTFADMWEDKLAQAFTKELIAALCSSEAAADAGFCQSLCACVVILLESLCTWGYDNDRSIMQRRLLSSGCLNAVYRALKSHSDVELAVDWAVGALGAILHKAILEDDSTYAMIEKAASLADAAGAADRRLSISSVILGSTTSFPGCTRMQLNGRRVVATLDDAMDTYSLGGPMATEKDLAALRRGCALLYAVAT